MRKFLQKAFKTLSEKMEVKSTNLTTLDEAIASINTLYGIGYKQGIGWLSALGAINFYTQVSPIANAIDLIAQKSSEIYVSIWDKKEKKYLKEGVSGTSAKILDLLKTCDYNKTYTEYMIAQASYYLITGNAFFISQFIENGEPLHLLMAKPQDIVISGNGTSIAEQYIWTDGNRQMKFNLDKVTMRYYATDANGIKYELKHLKCFNPKFNNGNLWGMSKLTQIYLEMEQYIAGTVHNKNLLANGARPSGVLTLDEEMSNDAYEKARAEVKNFYSGSKNAGNILIFEGEGSKFESFSISPRDMDFANLSEKNTLAIYNRLNIPLPFVSDKTMTYNNLSEALYQLYILAVIPLTEMIYECMTDLLLYRYKDGDQYEIHYDEMDIDVMAERKREEDSNTVRLGITTMNEARGMFSLNPLDEGGDDVFTTPNLIPLGRVIDEEKSLQKNVSKEKFVSILEKQNFDKKEIEKAVEKIYGNKHN